MLGDESLYKGSMCFAYVNVGKNSYVHSIQHIGSRRQNFYDYLNVHCSWIEHFHTPSVREKVIIDHNMHIKKPVVKTCYEVFNGSFQILPEYAKELGYRPSICGCYIAEMHGSSTIGGMASSNMKIWRDTDLINAWNNGYR